jgi:hypothetical protein
MSIGEIRQEMSRTVCLHPSVGTSVSPASMSPRQKVAAVAKVRCLEHRLFEGEKVSRSLGRMEAEAIVAEINELRRALGWLETDINGQWRWPHDHTDQPSVAGRARLTTVGSPRSS